MADSDEFYEGTEGDFDDDFTTNRDKAYNEYEDPNMCFDVPQDTPTTSEDHSQHFNVGVEFETGKELVEWAKKMAATHGHRLIVTSSKKNVYIVIRCHLSGEGREKRTVGAIPRNVGTKKCGCPFRIYCSKNSNDGLWRMNLKSGTHTHPTLPYPTGQGPDSRLTPEEYEVVKLLRRSHVKPALIMDRLRKDNPQTSTSVKHVYNQLEKMKKENMAGKTVIQHVMSNLQESGYEYWYRSNEGDDTLTDLMFAAPISLKLYRLIVLYHLSLHSGDMLEPQILPTCRKCSKNAYTCGVVYLSWDRFLILVGMYLDLEGGVRLAVVLLALDPG
ncbi:PREDICTED: uncharacterized protein LOC105954516 [Erythranthe guttata]|uniref:uncharacterized protein LOC105954516 n=1 Tax=Erythranthe guttata TaxID=4155 RepID=UPI00064E08FD|nr:PREDICTED: uncharacterized protein LOC105954516 [Erythranthe guttata]|eukprot:XP_012833640.1 PREDICTED: uncharacterized protein LOC105954516 [Erythranthe guttata]